LSFEYISFSGVDYPTWERSKENKAEAL